MSNTDDVFTRIRRFAGRKKRQLKRQMSSDAKSYYRSYVAKGSILPLNENLVQDILSYEPNSVLEFGCGVGKNLELLRANVQDHLGIDISEKAINIAKMKNLTVVCGDETKLKEIGNYDIVFTCSVLDHIEYIDDIVNDLKRIARVAIIIAETNTKLMRFYYPHDYESLGFVRTNYEYLSILPNEGEAIYHIWHFKTRKN